MLLFDWLYLVSHDLIIQSQSLGVILLLYFMCLRSPQACTKTACVMLSNVLQSLRLDLHWPNRFSLRTGLLKFSSKIYFQTTNILLPRLLLWKNSTHRLLLSRYFVIFCPIYFILFFIVFLFPHYDIWRTLNKTEVLAFL